MQSQLDRTRRQVLQTTGGLALLGLAGCLGAPSSPTAAGSAAPTPEQAALEDEHEEGDDHPEEEHHEDEDHPEEDHEAGDDHPEDEHHEEEEHHDEEETHAEGEGHGAEGPVEHADVAMQSADDGHHFHPHVAWVEVGGTVTYTNESGAHSVTAYHPDNDRPLRIPEGAEAFDSGILVEPGATFEHTFETEGVYDVFCLPHEQLGMIGSVVVGNPPHEGQPGMTEPQAGLSEPVANKVAELNEQVNTMLGHEH